ncbi:O-antigen polymerase [Limosilactobacillus reuteri]|uniref:O-antigen polymerase n=1 Tax=Limosilactobacillus reuteri TaxID=1598 RepID=UPI001E420B0E|nr:O-antigen polymerase [Limosilactobacillus reuteri]MCC4344801.1 oligosaccharide repeat unit polymerase [Limosilactobacillus reuteri]
MFILMLLLFLIFDVLTFLIFDSDLTAPPFLFCLSYTFSILCAFVNYTYWGLYNYSFLSFFIFTIGAIEFIIIAFIVKNFVGSPDYIYKKTDYNISSEERKYINLDVPFTICLFIFNIVILFFWIRNVRMIAGGGNFSQMMEAYRLKTQYSLDTDVRMPGYLTQASKVVIASGYIYTFAIIENMLNKTLNKKDTILVILIVGTYIVMSLFDSNRLNLLQLLGAAVIYYLVLDNKINYKKVGSIALRLVLLFAILLFIFYEIRLLIGRSNTGNDTLVEYITKYAGGSIKLFDLFVTDSVKHISPVWGFQTFSSLIKTFRGFIPSIPDAISNQEFRIFNGISLGNVYSAYRGWYEDFGLRGDLILQGIYSLFYSVFYYELKRHGFSMHKFATIIYGYMATSILLHPISDFLFSMFLSIGFCIYLVIFYLLYILVIKKRSMKI